MCGHDALENSHFAGHTSRMCEEVCVAAMSPGMSVHTEEGALCKPQDPHNAHCSYGKER